MLEQGRHPSRAAPDPPTSSAIVEPGRALAAMRLGASAAGTTTTGAELEDESAAAPAFSNSTLGPVTEIGPLTVVLQVCPGSGR